MDSPRTPTKIVACALFCLLGFLGNWFKLELFFNVDFLVGSFFVMLAIITLGEVYGIITGFVAGTCTYLLWNHPWAIIIFTAEALVVAALHTRRKGNPVIYDMLYWLCLGMPLVYLFYHELMGMQIQPTLLVMFKQAINGVCNTLLAMLAFIVIKLARRSSGAQISYSQLLFVLMLSMVFFPSMVLFVNEMRFTQQEITDSYEGKVVLVSKTARGILAGWIEEHHKSIQILSSLVGSPDTGSIEVVQHYVELVKAANPAFKKMGVINSSSITVAYSPLVEDGKSTLGVDFSDRPYIPIMRREKKPYIPDVVMGKLGTPSPIVLLLAPIVVADEYQGYCTGVVDLPQFTRLLMNLVERDIQITLVDGRDRVITSTIPGLAIMEPFPRPDILSGDPANTGTQLWKPPPTPNSSPMLQWRNSYLYKVARLSGGSHWRVIVEASCLPLTETLTQAGLSRFVILSLFILSAVLLSYLVSGRLLAGMVRLKALTRLLPQQLDDTASIAWPENSIEELTELTGNFRSMAFALSRDITARKQAEDALRDSLKEKTALLKEVHHRVKNNLQIVASLLGLQASRSDNPRAVDVLQDMRNRVKSMALLHETLYSSEKFASIDFSAYLRDLCSQLLASYGPAASRVKLEYHIAQIGLPLEQAVPCGLIVSELVTNALKHGFLDDRAGRVVVGLEPAGRQRLVLSVKDEGVGLPPGFDPASTSTLGLQLVSALAGQLGGQLEVEAAATRGAEFRVNFPHPTTLHHEECNDE